MDSARAIRWCSTMADAPRMDHKQLRRAKKLIRKLCCNYDHGNCLALDDGEPCACVQGISYSLLCNWFRNAVLPADHELLADVMRERPGKRCAVCGKPVYSSSNRAKYCPACAKQERRKQDAKRKREQYWNHKGLRQSIRKLKNNVYLRRIAPVQDVFSSAQGRYFF